jgi:hypothetical protein
VRRAVPLVLAVAALLAAVLVVAVTAAENADGSRDDRPAGPGLRLADRAGLVTVAMTARPDGLELSLIAPNIDAAAPEVTEVQLGPARGAAALRETEACGEGCVLAPGRLPEGPLASRVRVAYAGREDTATFRFPWPLPRDAGPPLQDAVKRTADVARWTVREQVTSDPRGGMFANPVRVTSGQMLAGTWAPIGAVDPRELPAPGGWRRIAYALPAAPMWIEVWIAPDGRIARDRIVGPKHLLTRTLTASG